MGEEDLRTMLLNGIFDSFVGIPECPQLREGTRAIEDYQNRNDEKWLAHSLVWLDNNGKVTMGSRPVNMNPLTNHVQSIPPKQRIY